MLRVVTAAGHSYRAILGEQAVADGASRATKKLRVTTPATTSKAVTVRANLVQVMQAAGARQLRVSVWDTDPESRAFAERRGFVERAHMLAMVLDLGGFDDRPYDAVIWATFEDWPQRQSEHGLSASRC